MGDIRNKIAKLERAKREHEAMERFLGTYGKPKPEPQQLPTIRCSCGLTFYETTVWAIHPDATPVLLVTEEAREMWMNAPAELALTLQRPPPAGLLRIVARDTKQDVG